MAYALVLSDGLQTHTDTTATFYGIGGDRIEVSGTGFQYDDDGYLKAGTIKKLVYIDLYSGTPEKAQTVTVGNIKAADLYSDLLSPSIGLIKQTGDWSTTDSITSATATKITLEMDDFSKVIITGTGLGSDPTKGKVTGLEHLDTSGDSIGKLTGLNVSLAAAFTALGQSFDIYDYLTQGANTITNSIYFGPRLEGGLGNDTLKGGTGLFPIAEYIHTAIAGIHADLAAGKVTGGGGTDKLVDIDGISGSNFNDLISGTNTKTGTSGDSLYGNGGKDTINGLGGNDFIDGGADNDKISAGSGDDRIDGGLGNDAIDGGAGSDLLSFDFQPSKTGITVHLDKAGVQDFGAWGKDSIKSIEGVNGTSFSDHIFGSKADNLLIGSGGADTLKGMDGNDTLYGDFGPSGSYFSGLEGNDTLDGGAGNDTISTSQGVDLLIGGAGKDTFIFQYIPNSFGGPDVDKIKDFNSADDTIKLQHFSYSGLDVGKLPQNAFVEGTEAKTDDQHIIYDKDTGNLYFDDDGKGSDEQVLFAVISNKTDLQHTDFVVI